MIFSIELAAIDASRNCRRRYRIEVAHDLFGACVVSVTFGRIAARGRTMMTVVENESEARRIVTTLIRRRASLQRRIGVAYRILALSACSSWSAFAVDLDPTDVAICGNPPALATIKHPKDAQRMDRSGTRRSGRVANQSGHAESSVGLVKPFLNHCA